jgi:hypothetical protein
VTDSEDGVERDGALGGAAGDSAARHGRVGGEAGESAARSSRWWFVGSTGVACGAIVGWLLWMLTAAAAAAFVVGTGVASILVVLAIAGARQNDTYFSNAVREADARARRQQVLDAMSETRRQAPPDPS